MKCMENCSGEIDLDNEVPVRTGCRQFSRGFACRKCGRLHFIGGDEVHKTPNGIVDSEGQKVYWIDGRVVRR